MRSSAVLLSLVAVAHAASVSELVQDEEWAAFKMEHQKQYSAAEDELRKKIFAESQLKVARHNRRFARGLTSFRVKINQFSDMLHSEYVASGYDGRTLAAQKQKSRPATFIRSSHLVLPTQVDWRKEGAVTDVKDQGDCDASWAFSTTGAFEGQIFRASGALVALSEQDLIDCSASHSNQGCGNGNMEKAFDYVRDKGGLDTEDDYPYEAAQKPCRYRPGNTSVVCVGYALVPRRDELALAAAVATVGPVAVAVDAAHETFQMYSDGIYYEEDCDQMKVNHAMLVVGYGTDPTGDDYWLVKNSRGPTWGAEGYIKMARNRNNNCGIATDAVYPLLGPQP